MNGNKEYNMTITIGLIIWLIAIMCILRFLAVATSDKRKYKTPDHFKITCPCGHTSTVDHLEWYTYRCSSCGMYYEKKEFSIR